MIIALLVACDPGVDEEAPEPFLDETETVEVWFSRAEEPVPVEREVRGAALDGALRALFAGPTEEERAAGISSWFSEETRGAIRRVQAEDGFVIADFQDLPDLIPGASTSAGSQELIASLDFTVFQFSWVDSVEYRLEGSCDEFWEWLQRSCERVHRP